MNERRRRPTTKLLLAAGMVALVLVLLRPLVFGGERSTDFESSPPQIEIPDPDDVYDPASAGESLPEGYRQVLGRDMIHPIYEPEFVDATEVDWPDNTDVIGIASGNEAKAYPVSHLSFREMVIDDIAGSPILVSW